MPVDPIKPARVAGPIPHYRKLAFLLGAFITVALLIILRKATGL